MALKRKTKIKKKISKKVKKRNIRYNYIDWCKGSCGRHTNVSSKGFCKQCTEAGEFGG